MIHGKWYKGSEDLSVLGRAITHEDEISWHLIIENGGAKVGLCTLTPYKDSFCIREIQGDEQTVELMLRMVAAKLDSFGKQGVYAKQDAKITAYGFISFEGDILKAEEIVLPKHCKE